MSIPVATVELEHAVHERGNTAFIITVDERIQAHVVQTCVEWDLGRLVGKVGAKTASFALARPHVSLLYPSRGPGDYSLIVDGLVTVTGAPGGARLFLTPTRAVLHRPTSGAEPVTPACGSDCLPVALAATSGARAAIEI